MAIRTLPGFSRLAALGLLFVISQTGVGADHPDPRALIEQAIAAQGGIKALEMIGATHLITKGQCPELAADAVFTCTTYVCPPDLVRRNWNFDTAGVRVPFVTVLQGDHGWETGKMPDKIENLEPPALDEYRNQLYLAQVKTLFPLLRERDVVLKLETDAKVNDSQASIVLVSKKGRPDVHLFFDQKSHLLVKVQYSGVYADSNSKSRFEEYLDDYRVVDTLEGDRKLLMAAGISIDATSLRALFRKQVLDQTEQDRARKLIKSLGDDKFTIREEAKDALIKLGPRVVPLLEEANHSTDPEILSRAKECLKALGKGADPSLLIAALHVYISLQDAQAFDVLMAYLPVLGQDLLGKEVRAALVGLAAANPAAKAKLLAAARGSDASLKKSVGTMTTASGLKEDIGYRVYPAGLKQPMKCIQMRDGKKSMEYQTTELRFYHSLPASMFARPLNSF
jgi:hypothetical protein